MRAAGKHYNEEETAERGAECEQRQMEVYGEEKKQFLRAASTPSMTQKQL